MGDKPTKLRKLSKSNTSRRFIDKAQVFKFRGQWLYACQEGCGGKYVPGATQALMFKIAEDHMKKKHTDKENPYTYRTQLITLRY